MNNENLTNEINKIIVHYTKARGTETDADMIIDNVWLGNFSVAHDIFFITDKKINCIVNATKNIPNCFNFIENFTFHMRDFEACHDDFIEIINKGADAIHYALNNNKIILVHCKRGHHRSAAILVFYLMKYRNMSLLDAILLIKRKRPTAFRRITCLLKTLINYEIYKNRYYSIHKQHNKIY